MKYILFSLVLLLSVLNACQKESTDLEGLEAAPPAAAASRTDPPEVGCSGQTCVQGSFTIDVIETNGNFGYQVCLSRLNQFTSTNCGCVFNLDPVTFTVDASPEQLNPVRYAVGTLFAPEAPSNASVTFRVTGMGYNKIITQTRLTPLAKFGFVAACD